MISEYSKFSAPTILDAQSLSTNFPSKKRLTVLSDTFAIHPSSRLVTPAILLSFSINDSWSLFRLRFAFLSFTIPFSVARTPRLRLLEDEVRVDIDSLFDVNDNEQIMIKNSFSIITVDTLLTES
ncbi:hypothetical protein NIES267_41880 [Calothrix parasitica NIES-267]|uniref:Uncharacterized protein n=1 Tax=Calothrix parasitica NIES-267 TaxID=1973488 RepID=A0A1Z4LTX7_9CYAN|nr:hypothetical protein NIES267_41880 [Calothrix parasitica NIES-267]